ncbi:glycosyltransferase family 2 protein [Oleispirillum naphthae]|uniref:glycosyltransferase family 2 protein n=1 Tax=Oleispirillum naphthae TaxID=2838853 RepID=UPI0030824279
MYRGMSVAVVVPSYNEETQISKVLLTMPDYVDRIVVVDDRSRDRTAAIVEEHAAGDERVVLLRHETNQGVGAAIATGYKWCRDNGVNCAAVMAGDGQMAPEDLPALLDPVVEDLCDYSKGNRLFTGHAWKKIPKIRYLGNAGLSLMTKVSSGYWCISDSQSGYTVINEDALATIDWDAMYKRYGQPNDLLVRLNIENFRVRDVPIEPVYNVGEVSRLKIRKVMFTIPWLLFKMFWRRMGEKYVIRDFHPLVLCYAFAFLLLLIDIPVTARLLWYALTSGVLLSTNLLVAMFLTINAFITGLAAMYMDMQYNQHLSSTALVKRRHPPRPAAPPLKG